MTRKGWLGTRGKPCLPVGTNELTDIRVVERSKAGAQEILFVNYGVGLKLYSIAEDSTALLRAFGEAWNRHLITRSAKATFLRTAEGWVSEARMRALLQAARLPEGARQVPFVEPDVKRLQQALDRFIVGSPGRGRACMRLPDSSKAHERSYSRGGDPLREYDVAYFHFPDMLAEPARQTSKGLSIVRDLERIGIMKSEPATPLVLNQPNELGGARFKILPAFHKYVSLEGNPCLAYGDLAFTIDWFRISSRASSPPSLEFLAIATPERLYEWVRETLAEERLPGIRAAIKFGLGVRGNAHLNQNAEWTITRMEVAEPAYATPEDWKDLFAKLPRAQEYRKANAAKTTPEIQAIVIRSGGRADIDVLGTGRPIILHLSSGDPVEWRLKVGKGAQLVRVVASASTRAFVVGVPPGVDFQVYSPHDPDPGRRPHGDREIPPLILDGNWHWPTNPGVIESRLEAEITSVQIEHGLKHFSVPRRWNPRP